MWFYSARAGDKLFHFFRHSFMSKEEVDELEDRGKVMEHAIVPRSTSRIRGLAQIA